MYNITEINKVMHVDSLDNFKRFCVMNGVCGIDHADASVSGLKYEVLGTEDSFYLPGVSRLVVVDVTGLKGKH